MGTRSRPAIDCGARCGTAVRTGCANHRERLLNIGAGRSNPDAVNLRGNRPSMSSATEILCSIRTPRIASRPSRPTSMRSSGWRTPRRNTRPSTSSRPRSEPRRRPCATSRPGFRPAKPSRRGTRPRSWGRMRSPSPSRPTYPGSASWRRRRIFITSWSAETTCFPPGTRSGLACPRSPKPSPPTPTWRSTAASSRARTGR